MPCFFKKLVGNDFYMAKLTLIQHWHQVANILFPLIHIPVLPLFNIYIFLLRQYIIKIPLSFLVFCFYSSRSVAVAEPLPAVEYCGVKEPEPLEAKPGQGRVWICNMPRATQSDWDNIQQGIALPSGLDCFITSAIVDRGLSSSILC